MGEVLDYPTTDAPLLRIGAHRRLTLSAVCDDVVVAGLICPQGLWPLSLLTEGTVVPL